MNYRENFVNDLKCGIIIKGNKTFKDLAKLYGYPKENGDNLCKKDYYKFLKTCHESKVLYNNVETTVNNIDKNVNVSDNTNKPNYILSSYRLNKEGEMATQWFKFVNKLDEQADIKEIFREVISEVNIISDLFSYPDPSGYNLLVINATDVHLNKKYFNKETSLDDQINTFKAAVGYSLEKADNIGKIMLNIGHDFLHSEWNGTTTRGTPQDTLESFEVLFRKALKALIDVITYCASIAPIDVILVNGNHAYAAELQLFSALEVYYEAVNNNNIKLFGGKESRKYYSFHNNSFMLIHDTMNKISDLPLLFATEQPKLFVKANKYILSGHLHSKKEVSFLTSSENFGIEHIQCPSLSGADKWHDDNMYIGNKERMLSLVVSPIKGIINQIIFNK